MLELFEERSQKVEVFFPLWDISYQKRGYRRQSISSSPKSLFSLGDKFLPIHTKFGIKRFISYTTEYYLKHLLYINRRIRKVKTSLLNISDESISISTSTEFRLLLKKSKTSIDSFLLSNVRSFASLLLVDVYHGIVTFIQERLVCWSFESTNMMVSSEYVSISTQWVRKDHYKVVCRYKSAGIKILVGLLN